MGEFMGLSVLTLLFWLGINGVEPLKNVQVFVPQAVSLGNPAKLTCLYDLEHNESLYAVKFYLETEEFYRYVPKEVPAIQVFPITGLDVDTSKSDAHNVVLRSVRHDQTGSYKCEVSADAPFFDTDMVSSQMTVVEFPTVPEKVPLIAVPKYRYEVGERIKANCSFGPTRPASNITWFINNVQVRDQFISELPVFPDANKRAWVKYSLETDTDVNSFRNGKLKLKCIASVYSIYHRMTEIQIEEEKPRSASVMGTIDSTGKQISLNTPGNGTPGSSSSNDASSSSTKLVSSSSSVQLLLLITFMLQTLSIFSASQTSSSSPAPLFPNQLTLTRKSSKVLSIR